MYRVWRGVAIAALVAVASGASGQIAVSPAPVVDAAGVVSNLPVAAVPGGITCLTRRVANAGTAPYTFTAYAADVGAKTLSAKGLAASRCVVTATAVADYQKQVCDMVSSGNQAVQNRIEQLLGAQPKALCAAARAAAPLVGIAVLPEPVQPDQVVRPIDQARATGLKVRH